jgi:hypothetical protein
MEAYKAFVADKLPDRITKLVTDVTKACLEVETTTDPKAPVATIRTQFYTDGYKITTTDGKSKLTRWR